DSNCQEDYDDIRFTNSSNQTLDYWIESSDSFSATIWVEVDSLASGDTTLYLYYDNSSETTAVSNGENTFEFFDDFEDGSINTSIWNIKSSYGSCGIKSNNQYEGTYAIGSDQGSGQGGGTSVYDQNHFFVKLSDGPNVGYRVFLNLKRWYPTAYWGHFAGFGLGGTNEIISIPRDNVYRLYESRILRIDSSTLSVAIYQNGGEIYNNNRTLSLGSEINYGIQTRHNDATDNSIYVRGDVLRVLKYTSIEPTASWGPEESF
ncbi:MAG: DUF2341 domain-containing protein, partial [Candidatus Pacebacteria bacterium]|nr:DUF2341 domain-containing protein [Candidatus Paceibacterota bacterium]